MSILLMLILGVLGAAVLFALINEYATWVVFGSPYKNYRLYCDLIEADLSTGHKFMDIYCTSNGFLSTLPSRGIFGHYYFHHDTKGNIRIPWNTPIHKMAEECMKGK